MANITIGQEAPDVTLRDGNNREVTLSSPRGSPAVLVLYPLDSSPIGTNELCAVRDDYSSFEAEGAMVFGISRDSPWTHKAFREREAIKHSLLADMKGQVAGLYAAWNEQLGLAERLTVVIDAQGVVRYVIHNRWPGARAQGSAGCAWLGDDTCH